MPNRIKRCACPDCATVTDACNCGDVSCVFLECVSMASGFDCRPDANGPGDSCYTLNALIPGCEEHPEGDEVIVEAVARFTLSGLNPLSWHKVTISFISDLGSVQETELWLNPGFADPYIEVTIPAAVFGGDQWTIADCSSCPVGGLGEDC